MYNRPLDSSLKQKALLFLAVLSFTQSSDSHSLKAVMMRKASL